ncbi:MAG: HAD-IIIA family hydrolase [Firmicutes bacterium]|nr:HAD-IIIA family hydrolase [Bacillota bacterium]
MNFNLFQCQEQVISSENLFTGRGGIFFDRDGVIIAEKNYLFQPSQIKILEGVISGLNKLRSLDMPIYLITNQAGIAHGFFNEEQLHTVHIHLSEKLLESNVKFRATFYCPHHPGAEVSKYHLDCLSRKPNPGLLYQAARFDKLDLKHSYLIGDKLSDIEAGRRAGTRTILVLTGYGAVEYKKIKSDQKPDFIASNIDTAADWITYWEKNRHH